MRKVSFTNSQGEQIYARIDTIPVSEDNKGVRLTENVQSKYNSETKDFDLSNRYTLLITNANGTLDVQNANSVYRDPDTKKILAFDRWTYLSKEDYDKLVV